MIDNKPEYKLLIVAIKWPPETFILRRITWLSELNIHIRVAAATPNAIKNASPSKNIQVFRLLDSRSSVLVRALNIILNIVWLLKSPRKLKTIWDSAHNLPLRVRLSYFSKSLRLARENPDIVHFEWNSAAIDYMHLFDVWNCPVVISCRGSQVQIVPHNFERQDFVDRLRTSFEKAQAIHCVSLAMQDAVESVGAAPEKITVIRPAVDPTVFKPSANIQPRQSTHIISIGSLNWVKGYPYALTAIRMLLDKGLNIRYEIIGAGHAEQEIQYTIYDLSLQNHVTLRGRVPPETVLERLQNSDIFLLTSWSEGISNAALEAMSCALPVVTTDCGGMREAVNDGVEGFVVPLQSPTAVAEALEKLVLNPSLSHEMGQRGRQRVLADFTLEQQIADFHQLYQQINLA